MDPTRTHRRPRPYGSGAGSGRIFTGFRVLQFWFGNDFSRTIFGFRAPKLIGFGFEFGCSPVDTQWITVSNKNTCIIAYLIITLFIYYLLSLIYEFVIYHVYVYRKYLLLLLCYHTKQVLSIHVQFWGWIFTWIGIRVSILGVQTLYPIRTRLIAILILACTPVHCSFFTYCVASGDATECREHFNWRGPDSSF